MILASARPADETERVVRQYSHTLFRVCLALTGQKSDAEDAVQDVFLKYLRKHPAFAEEEHERAWLITVAINTSKDQLRRRARHPLVAMDELADQPAAEETGGEAIAALLRLPEKFRAVLYLYYVEGYNTGEIAGIIRKTPSAVKMRLSKGRMLYRSLYQKGI